MDFVPVNLNTIGVKAKSKAEIYRIHILKGKMYLMSQREYGLDFLSDICLRKKKVFYSDEIKVCNVPHFKGLTNDKIIDFIVNTYNGECYLPRNYIAYPHNRTWLCNIANTMDSVGFEALIKSVLNNRKEQMLEKNNLILEIDPKIAKIFEHSKHVSVEKGKSNKLLRKTLLRDKKMQRRLEEEKIKDGIKILPNFKNEIDKLRLELKVKNKELENMKRKGRRDAVKVVCYGSNQCSRRACKKDELF